MPMLNCFTGSQGMYFNFLDIFTSVKFYPTFGFDNRKKNFFTHNASLITLSRTTDQLLIPLSGE